MSIEYMDFLEGVLDLTSRLSIASQQDSDGRKRIDGILVINLDDKSSLELRIAGFGDEVGTEMQIAGLFRGESDILEPSSFPARVLSSATF